MNTSEEMSGDTLWFGNTSVTILVSSTDGADGMAVIEHRMPYGEAPPLHIHHSEDEIFFCLEGEMLVEVAGVGRLLQAGDCAIAPKGVPHRFRVVSRSGARSLTVTRGRDFETMVRAVGRAPAHAGLPAFAAPTPEIIGALTAACAANAIEIIGAPLAA